MSKEKMYEENPDIAWPLREFQNCQRNLDDFKVREHPQKYIVEAIEDGYLKCEDEHGEFEYYKQSFMPDIQENDVILIYQGRYTKLEDETAERKKRIDGKLERLLNKNKK